MTKKKKELYNNVSVWVNKKEENENPFIDDLNQRLSNFKKYIELYAMFGKDDNDTELT